MDRVAWAFKGSDAQVKENNENVEFLQDGRECLGQQLSFSRALLACRPTLRSLGGIDFEHLVTTQKKVEERAKCDVQVVSVLWFQECGPYALWVLVDYDFMLFVLLGALFFSLGKGGSHLSNAFLQEFRGTTAKVLSCMAAADFVINTKNDPNAEKGALGKVMQFVASMGMSKGDFPQELKARLEGNEAGPKAKAKASTKRKKTPASAQAEAKLDEDQDGQSEEKPNKKKKTDPKSKKRKSGK